MADQRSIEFNSPRKSS